MLSESSTNRIAKLHRIHGFWNAACKFAPASPATTPAIVNTTHVASTYTMDNTNARRVVTFSPEPAMMPDRIGIIGNTQGVNASRRPNPKKLNKASQRLLERFAASACSSDWPPTSPLPLVGEAVRKPGEGSTWFTAAAAGTNAAFAAASSAAVATGISTLTTFVITG